MNALDVHDAIKALDAAAKTLRVGEASIDEQMAVGMDCHRAAIKLETELAKINVVVSTKTCTSHDWKSEAGNFGDTIERCQKCGAHKSGGAA